MLQILFITPLSPLVGDSDDVREFAIHTMLNQKEREMHFCLLSSFLLPEIL